MTSELDFEQTPNTDHCFKAALLKRALSVHPSDIPEEYQYFRAEGYTCPYVSPNSDEDCTFSDPMIFMHHNVGFTAIGAKNFCQMSVELPRQFKKEASPHLSTRLRNFGKSITTLLT